MERTLGIYIHIPFCASKCGYCDFYSLAGQERRMPDYEQALCAHIEESAGALAPYVIDSVYFGGGTPSFFGAKRLCSVFNTLKRTARVRKNAEVTVEMNPDSVDLKSLRLLRREGVNRISLGAQSANDDILRLIGRRHSWRQVEHAAALIRQAGFDNLSLDLIYGLPSQTKSDWTDTLGRAMALQPEHLSCYGLKLEEGTPLYRYHDSPALPDDDEQADMYLYTVEELERCNYHQYEISNFSLPGKQSRHNLKYWRRQEYMGFGPGAHSFVGSVRYSFVRDLCAYLDGVAGRRDILDEYIRIEGMECGSEYIMLGLRTTQGISAQEYCRAYRSSFAPIEEALKGFQRKGWAVRDGDRWRFTSSGFLLSNLLIGRLLEAQAEEKRIAVPWVQQDPAEVFGETTELPPGDDVFYRAAELERR